MDTAPLRNPAFKAPGLLEKLREAVFGIERPLTCAQIEITSVCGGQCSYCPREVQKDSWNARHMQPETFAALWPILRQTARAHLQGWGEPLLHPDFFAFQKLAAKAGCATSTTSSGQVMTPDMAAQLAASGMDILAFSLAGTDAASNAARKNVPFEKVADSIRQARKAIKAHKTEQPLEIHLAYLLLADRMEAVAKLPELMDELEIDLAVVSTLDYMPEPAQRHLAITAQDTDKLAKAEELLARAAEAAERRDRFIHYSLPGEKIAPGGCRENVARNVYIDAAGNLSPCVYLNVPGSDAADKRRVFGNANERNPWEIWQKEDFKAFRKLCLAENADPVCEACPKRREYEA